jgi:DNA-binding MarR family transcriptional regulator
MLARSGLRAWETRRPPTCGSCFKFEAQCHCTTASNLKQEGYTRGVPAALDPLQLAAYFALIEVSSLLKHAVERHLRVEGGVTYVQFEILTRLFGTPSAEQRMTDLADGIVYSRSGLTYQAAHLEEAGLISRLPAVDDERSTVVKLTAAGRARVERLLPGHIQLVQSMLFDHLTPDDVTLLTDILGRVRDQLRSAPPRSAAPRHRHR